MERPLLAQRFQVEALAGAGGMGCVYRAVDLSTGERVAVKILVRRDEIDLERFAREVEILSTLRHPRIARYLAHGDGAEGPWLAMEWLDGESLAARLERGPLSIEESLRIATGAAEGLAVLHARGLVHRDIKPSNLFLVDGDPGIVKLLDFGIARFGAGSKLTRSGALVGTPGYVAPEQARGGRPLDARADVFGVGCVLFECLTGRPAFAGEHTLAVLAKILLEDPPSAREIRPTVPSDLDGLVARMISKTADHRPRDASAVLAELAALGPFEDARANASPAATVLTAREQRLLSIIVVTGAGVSGEEPAGPSAKTLDMRAVQKAREAELLRAVRSIAAQYDGRIVSLAGGALLVVLRSAGAATDLAARAARCALALRARLPGAELAVATGRGVLAGARPTGEVIDRGVGMIRSAHEPGGVRVDDVTAALIEGHFELRPEGNAKVVVGEIEDDNAARARLGRPTPFVGRDEELAILLRSYEATRKDGAARALLVLGVPGVGKSRLAREFCAEIAKSERPPSIWRARGDALRTASPFGLVAPMIRHLCAIHEGDSLEVRHQKLTARVSRHLGEADRGRICQFIGEVVTAPFVDEANSPLRTARRDPLLMADQIRRAWEDWVAAECTQGPIVLVLEDLHWADRASIKLLHSLLRRRRGHAIFALALARPEILEHAPGMWQEASVQQLHLGELPEQASRSLIHAMLGETATDEMAIRLAQLAAGNALFLEELIRATSEGKQATLPETVLAMLAARLERLAPEPRRLLRAASVFGEALWSGGLARLVGEPEPQVREWLAELVDQELLHSRAESRFENQLELGFHHALLRDAAYALLTEKDRETGHRLAAEWLEQAGESDSAILAGHFERGGERLRAVDHYLHAAQRALDANALETARAHAERGIACGAQGETLGRLRLIEAAACVWLGNYSAAEPAAAAAIPLLPKESPEYYRALQVASDVLLRVGVSENLRFQFDIVMDLKQRGASSPDFIVTCTRSVVPFLFAGMRTEAEALMAGLEEAAAASGDPSAIAHVKTALGALAVYAGDPSAGFRWMRAASEEFERIGLLREASSWRANTGFLALQSGAAPAEAIGLLRETVAIARRLGLEGQAACAQQNVGAALLRMGELEEARQVQEEALQALAAQGDRRMEGGSHVYLAQGMLAAGDLAQAEHHARAALERLDIAKPLQPQALATLARILLAARRTDEALATAQQAYELMLGPSGVEEGEALIRLVYAEALEAAGKADQARDVLAQASQRLHDRAALIADPEWRRAFLEAVPENAQTLATAARYHQ